MTSVAKAAMAQYIQQVTLNGTRSMMPSETGAMEHVRMLPLSANSDRDTSQVAVLRPPTNGRSVFQIYEFNNRQPTLPPTVVQQHEVSDAYLNELQALGNGLATNQPFFNQIAS